MPAASSVVPRPIVDPALPQLEALQDPVRMASELATARSEAVAGVSIAVVRHKPGRRCILRYDVRPGRPGDGGAERLYGKTFASDRGPRVEAVTRAISTASAFGPEVRLPEPVAYLPHLKLLLQREVPGAPVTRRLAAGDPALAATIAEALHNLHSSSLNLARRHGPDKEFAPLRERVRRLSDASPDLADNAERCLALVEAKRRRLRGWRWRPIHRDCYHDQFLCDPGGLSVLDLDDAAMSEPAIDIANFLAHLRLLGLQEHGEAGALRETVAAFEATARRLDPELDAGLLRLLEGATLLRLAEIHRPRDRGAWLATRLLDEAEPLLTRPSA